MQTGHILNLGSKVRNDDSTGAREEDFRSTADLMAETRADLRRTMEEIDLQRDEYDWHERRTKILSGVLVVLIALLAVAVWFVYPIWTGQKKAAADMLGLQTASNTLGERMSSAENGLGKVTKGFPALTDRMSQLESNLQTARNQAQAAATQVGQRIRADLNQSIKAIQSRVSGLESNQRESSERVTQLQEQVTGLQREIAAMREEASAATGRIKELNEAQQTSNREVSGLNERVVTNQTALNTLANRVDRKRIDFEVSSRQAKQVAPDLYLTLTHADTGKQEVDATLKLGEDAGYVTIRGQGVRKPVLFHMPDEKRPIELVFTQILKNGASGYLMMPVPPSAPSAATKD
jgi:DNA repair exonuclease SbcCD ATPase subunit